MKKSNVLSVAAIIMLLLTSLLTNITYAETSSIAMELDKTKANVGDIIVATIKINNINNFCGYQINIKYDPSILQAVNLLTGEPISNFEMPAVDGTLLIDDEYTPIDATKNDVDAGILNFGKAYAAAKQYRESGKPETTGIIGKIGFKALKTGNTSIGFEDTNVLPDGIKGTNLFDWHTQIIRGYEVVQPKMLTIVDPTQTPTQTPVATPSSTPSNIPDVTLPKDAHIALELDKTKVKVGDVIVATVKANNLVNLAGFQVNIKYDPNVLQAVDPVTGKAFTNTTGLVGSELITNKKYNPLKIATNEINSGVINYSSIYTELEAYRGSGAAEKTGIIGKVGFKVLKAADTTVKFEEPESMPNSVEGTYALDWYMKTMKGYEVIQPGKITVTKKPQPTEIKQPDEEIPAAVGEHYSYLTGYPDKLFRPEKSITRAEAAVIFAKLMGANENTKIDYSISYNDLDSSHWAYWAIKFVSYKKLFTGYPDGSFKPNQNITRAEFSTAVFKLLVSEKGLEEKEIEKFKFDDVKGHWAQKFIEQLSDLGYINGYPDGTFKPNNNIKRSESVAMINRAMGRGPLHDAPQTFDDVPQTHWAFKDIAEGVLNHKYKLDQEGKEYLLEVIEK
ncbi:MAG TPA: cohesin domain-containing protein [Acetivibrio sp.]|uniref:S-layer homology domain-containing protein n=1 Tax=Acetivibrio sp. TaxID=1872092 RepID=UPI002B924DDA|nr:S-layer homology domain-containing protein [Acetivibrio sp.]HOM03700.1 cohesin domain-containing protein [Acetivibrio sp.]